MSGWSRISSECVLFTPPWVMSCWCGYLSGAIEVQIVCIWSIWSSWCLQPQTPSSLASFKSRLSLPFWYWLTQVVLEKRPLNGCSNSDDGDGSGSSRGVLVTYYCCYNNCQFCTKLTQSTFTNHSESPTGCIFSSFTNLLATQGTSHTLCNLWCHCLWWWIKQHCRRTNKWIR